MKKIRLGILSPLIKSKTDIHSFASNAAFNVLRELKKYDDIEIVKHFVYQSKEVKNIHNLDLSGIDHLYGIVLRQWSWIPQDKVKLVKSKIKGKLFQYYDSGNRPEPTDVNFSFLNQDIVKREGYEDVYVGWAADPEVFHINKSKEDEVLRILIDHSHFSSKSNKNDRSDEIAKMCYEFSKNENMIQLFNKINQTNFKKVCVNRLVSGGIEEVDITKKVNLNYSHNSVNQLSLAKEYAKAHIFIPTHKESLGLCILEAAMSGCFIISPKGFIKKDKVLNKVNHIEFDRHINWDSPDMLINPLENRNRVIKWTWERTVKIMYNTIKRYDKKLN